MSSLPDAGEANVEAASSQLNDGLKSCRAVVSNYRALLAGKCEQRAPFRSDQTETTDG